jgi:hypothetical protein
MTRRLTRRTRTVLALAGSLTIAASCGLHRPSRQEDAAALPPIDDGDAQRDRADSSATSRRTLAALPAVDDADAARG